MWLVAARRKVFPTLKIPLRRAIVVSATFVVLAAGVTPATAASDDDDESIAAVAADVAPAIDVVVPTDTAGTVTALGSDVTTVAGAVLGDGIEVHGPEGVPVLDVSVGFGDASAAPEVTADGSIVHAGSDEGSVVIQGSDDGVRLQTILESAADSHEIAYTFGEGFVPSTDGDRFFVSHVADDGSLSVYEIEAPWAFDATGATVGTSYVIEGDAVVQVVQPGPDSVYPIVADPTMKWVAAGFGAQLTRAETNDLAASGTAAGMCAAFVRKLPGTWKIQGATACTVLASYAFTQAQRASARNSCVFIQILPVPAAWIGCS